MKKTGGFSLIEILMVIVILTALIAASRIVFTLPSKFIMESERCVNTIHGEVTKFFYESITGKAKTTTGTEIFGTSPEQYSIIFNGGIPKHGIDLGFVFLNSGSEQTVSIKEIKLESGSIENNIAGCIGVHHRVMLSGGIQYAGTKYPMKLSINKNIFNQNTSNIMSICAVSSGSHYDCITGSTAFTGVIDYMICKGENGIYNNSCRLFFSEYIDTRSQTIFSKKCLSFPIDKECQQWSISSGYNF